MWVALLQDYSYILASQKIWYLTISLPSDLQISLIGQNKKKKIIEQSAWQRGDEQKHSQPVAGVCRGLPKTCVYYGLYENGESCLGFFEIAFVVVVDTHLPRFQALAYVLAHCDELTHVVIRASSSVCWGLLFCLRKAFIFQEFSWRSIVDLSLLNL